MCAYAPEATFAASSLRMRQIAPPKSAGGREEVSLSVLLLYEIFKVQPRAANCRKSCKRERPKKRSGKKPSTIAQKTGGVAPCFFYYLQNVHKISDLLNTVYDKMADLGKRKRPDSAGLGKMDFELF